MMRKLISVTQRAGWVTLMAVLACAFGLAQKAGASVTIDLIWDDTGTNFLEIMSGDPGNTSGVRSMAVIMTTTTRLIAAGTSVVYPAGMPPPLQVSSTVQWTGVKISKGVFFQPIGSATDYPAQGKISSFASVVPAPNAPPSAPPGTYRLGTIVWNTASAPLGSYLIAAFTDPLVDGYTNGDGNLITGVEVLHNATLNVPIPEPATVSLLGLGLVGLLLAARRRRSEV